jgi:hypothetical protein
MMGRMMGRGNASIANMLISLCLSAEDGGEDFGGNDGVNQIRSAGVPPAHDHEAGGTPALRMRRKICL